MADARISAGRFAPGQAPRITPEAIQAEIVDCEFIVRGKFTLCLLTLRNGTIISGESSCVYPENFDAEMGMKIAREVAERKVYSLEGYLMATHRFEELKRNDEA